MSPVKFCCATNARRRKPRHNQAIRTRHSKLSATMAY